jgi:hypothetical protein
MCACAYYVHVEKAQTEEGAFPTLSWMDGWVEDQDFVMF